MSTKPIFTTTIRIVSDATSSGFYWFKIPKRLVHASRERQLNFFLSAKAERYGPFKTEEDCDAAQHKTMEEQIGCSITDGGELPASWSIN